MVVEHASMNMGGEAARPLHYFRVLRSRGVEVWMLTHARVREEVRGLVPPEDFRRFYFVPDTGWHKLFWRLGRALPHQVRITTFGALSHFVTQLHQRRLAQRLVRSLKIDVVHEPIPISPKQPSLLYDVGAPVVIGPLNGDINYPPAFAHMESPLIRLSVRLSRAASTVLNRFIPGKLRAHTILVSNERTRRALPAGCRGRVIELVANAVDMRTWRAKEETTTHPLARPLHRAGSGEEYLRAGETPVPRAEPAPPARFAFLGRLVDFKMVDLLLEAFKPVAERHGATLDVIGDGAERPHLERLARELGLADRVTFAGWMTPAESAARLARADVLVFPSLRECGGAVVMEAMAVGLPVIAADWGGPADYVGTPADGAGVLVTPTTRESFVRDLSTEMDKLAASPELRAEMSRRARQRAVNVFDWEARVERLLEVYRSVRASASVGRPG
jgi:glycosyltransferase involved in cell wall biosynthesis